VCYRTESLKGFTFLDLLRVFGSDWRFYRDLSSYSAMYYCECLATNTGIIMATQIGDVVQLASYTQLINVVIFQQHLGNAYNSLLKLRINYFIASDKPSSAKLLFSSAVAWYLVLYCAMCVVLWLAGPKLAQAYNQHNDSSRQCLEQLLEVYKYLVVVDLLLVYISTVARLTKKVRVSLSLGATILVFCQIFISMSLVKLGVATACKVLVVSHVLHLVHFTVMIAIFSSLDWTQLAPTGHRSLQPRDQPLLELKGMD